MRRVAGELLDDAVRRLRTEPAPTVEDVRKSRTDLKKYRALLRLAAVEPPARGRPHRAGCARDAARRLSAQRDQAVLSATVRVARARRRRRGVAADDPAGAGRPGQRGRGRCGRGARACSWSGRWPTTSTRSRCRPPCGRSPATASAPWRTGCGRATGAGRDALADLRPQPDAEDLARAAQAGEGPLVPRPAAAGTRGRR